MRDNIYMTVTLICACLMLLAGLAFTGLELYQYSKGAEVTGAQGTQREETTPAADESGTSPAPESSAPSAESADTAPPQEGE